MSSTRPFSFTNREPGEVMQELKMEIQQQPQEWRKGFMDAFCRNLREESEELQKTMLHTLYKNLYGHAPEKLPENSSKRARTDDGEQSQCRAQDYVSVKSEDVDEVARKSVGSISSNLLSKETKPDVDMYTMDNRDNSCNPNEDDARSVDEDMKSSYSIDSSSKIPPNFTKSGLRLDRPKRRAATRFNGSSGAASYSASEKAFIPPVESVVIQDPMVTAIEALCTKHRSPKTTQKSYTETVKFIAGVEAAWDIKEVLDRVESRLRNHQSTVNVKVAQSDLSGVQFMIVQSILQISADGIWACLRRVWTWILLARYIETTPLPPLPKHLEGKQGNPVPVRRGLLYRDMILATRNGETLDDATTTKLAKTWSWWKANGVKYENIMKPYGTGLFLMMPAEYLKGHTGLDRWETCKFKSFVEWFQSLDANAEIKGITRVISMFTEPLFSGEKSGRECLDFLQKYLQRKGIHHTILNPLSQESVSAGSTHSPLHPVPWVPNALDGSFKSET